MQKTMHSENNLNLSALFRNMAAVYRFQGPEERFRALAYAKASRVIAALPEDISVYAGKGGLEKLPGIGEGIAGQIAEFLAQGKIRKHDQLVSTVPVELLELMEIKGFGPRSVKTVHEQLSVNSKAEFINALQDGRISGIRGFGKKKVENMMRALKLHKEIEDRMLLTDALEEGSHLIGLLNSAQGITHIELAGSLRRRKETIGDFDILVACKKEHRMPVLRQFTSGNLARQVLSKGDTKASIILQKNGKQADLRIVNEWEWGAALQYFTGSKEHNIHLRTIAREKGYKLSEYGIFSLQNGERLGGATEAEIYQMLGMQEIPPEMRENQGEIELAAKNRLPLLLNTIDIRGDLQMHTVWSDGLNTIEEMAEYAMNQMKYDYIVISDHSKSSRIAGGMNEKQILSQISAIEALNKKLGKPFVKTGLEVDILPDGSLDIADEILSQLDWVTAAIHSRFTLDNTRRIISACRNPYVNCIGHPSGRLIGSREPYLLDFDAVFNAAAVSGTALEINAQPERLDLNDGNARRAREAGVRMVISTDAHNTNGLEYMHLGVSQARRAWCSASDILNTNPWEVLAEFRQAKIKRLKRSEAGRHS